jgi:hypothetical protein
MIMPFVLCNTSATFEQLMKTVLRGLKSCLGYRGDIVIGCTFKERFLNLWKEFQQFQEVCLTQPGEDPTLSEGSSVPRAYYRTWGDNHQPQEAESHTGMAEPD